MHACASDADSLTQVPRIFVFSLIIYFMVHLQLGAGIFFTYFINILIGCE